MTARTVIGLFILAVLLLSVACEKVIVDPDVSTSAVNPQPSDGASGISVAIVLSWEIKGDLADYDFDIYFGDTNPPPLVKEGHNGTQYDVGHLRYETPYFWKIVTRDRYGGAEEGPVWSFTTWDGYFILEGFEGAFPPEGWTADPEWTLSEDAYEGSYSAECYIEYPGYGMVSSELTTPWLNKDMVTYDRAYLSHAFKWDSSTGVGLVIYVEGGNGITRLPVSSNKGYWQISSLDFQLPLEGDSFRLRFACMIYDGVVGDYVHLWLDDIKLTDFMQLPPAGEAPPFKR